MQGWVADGYETVLEEMQRQRPALGRGGGAFAAWVRGEQVADLWTWDADTLAVLMSATKGVCALAVHMLADRGAVSIDAPLASFWDGFRDPRVTVRHVLSHSSGMVEVPGYERLLGLDGSGWDDTDAIVRALAGAEPAWEPGTAHGYQALTFGFLTGEIVRRIDGRTIGTFVREEIAGPLGLDLWLGTPTHAIPRVARVLAETAPQDDPALAEVRRLMTDPSALAGRAMFAMRGENMLTRLHAFMASPRNLALEIGSSNGTATARALASLYRPLASDGAPLVSPDAIALMSGTVCEGPDAVFVLPSAWSLGFQKVGAPFWPFGPNPAAFGHCGAGGQIGFADPDAGVAAAFVRSELGTLEAGAKVVGALYGCL